MVEEFVELEQSPDAIRSQIASGMRYAYILDGGDRAGYVGYGADGGTMHLSKLYLFEGHRGRGLGSAVMDMVIAEASAEGLESVVLEVNERNSGAIHLYRSKGFVETGRAGYMRVIMTLPLRPSSTACTSGPSSRSPAPSPPASAGSGSR